jgi:hypothetical protein
MTISEMVPEQIKKEIAQLVKNLNYHCYRYYVLDAPVISSGGLRNRGFQPLQRWK